MERGSAPGRADGGIVRPRASRHQPQIYFSWRARRVGPFRNPLIDISLSPSDSSATNANIPRERPFLHPRVNGGRFQSDLFFDTVES
jgi:hypothetical protein